MGDHDETLPILLGIQELQKDFKTSDGGQIRSQGDRCSHGTRECVGTERTQSLQGNGLTCLSFVPVVRKNSSLSVIFITFFDDWII